MCIRDSTHTHTHFFISHYISSFFRRQLIALSRSSSPCEVSSSLRRMFHVYASEYNGLLLVMLLPYFQEKRFLASEIISCLMFPNDFNRRLYMLVKTLCLASIVASCWSMFHDYNRCPCMLLKLSV